MSHLVTRITPQEFAPPAMIDRMRTRMLVVGAVFGVVTLALAFKGGGKLFLQAWLFAFMFWFGLSMGSLVLLMLQYTSGGNWGRIGRRIWEAAASNLWLMFLCWLPLLYGMWSNKLFVWTTMKPEELGVDKVKYYLNPTFFTVRGVLFFAVWGFLAWRLYQWSKKEEAGETAPAQFVGIQNLSGFGIVFYGMSLTFFVIDLVMSLYPQWWSTVFGMLFMVGQVLTAFCFTIWLLTRLAQIEPLSRMFKIDYLHDFGKLMFAFVILWAYLSFSQWLIIWNGNMLSEIRWYLMRLNHGWQYFGTLLIFVHFVFPFALLLSRNLKRNAPRIVAVAFLLLFMRLVDLFWQIAPNFYPGAPVPFGSSAQTGLSGFGWVDGALYVTTVIAMGGFWLFFFFLRLSKRSLLPVNDPGFVEMLEAKHG
ncbi:MAG TPA: hypothetical protein VKH81_18175 [Candidatus Angelobacter sp.]|nr:hypothetical protein [Candidatus Angelobacter sp.]